ncbi:MAG: prepilin-type N-terminal cleavage/methylation domain-containing protein [Holophagaceae bacterium]|nr:prepilin-type N-terminal cleavage/methylation domain-containing protein [Holophagaceae bacterium]
MAKNLISKVKEALGGNHTRQRGFTLVELLVAAFILAIGILGVTMLQAIALRSSRGTINMGTAARIAGQILDEVEVEGRLSWLNITDSNRLDPNLGDLNAAVKKYISQAPGSPSTKSFNIGGTEVDETSDDPAVSTQFFTVVVERVEIEPAQGVESSTGQISDFKVRITFHDNLDARGQVIPRSFNLSRRIIHG